ncbi:MAG TPA: 30S ribosomal protein S12 methylthiotransferase RimO [Candidatus Krumholzibacteria bacterium]|nr:30S ribosomal protein S12 methylthiotransferase RimO [Candidatus Krumholzibacteria bacterium]
MIPVLPEAAPGAPAPTLAGLRVYLDSLGCAKNLVDSEATLGLLAAAGAAPVEDPAAAEILLVNTCGFLEAAREESIQRILELAAQKSYGRARVLGVLGCLVSRAPAELAAALPEVDVWLPAGAQGTLCASLEAVLARQPAPQLRAAADRSGSRRAPSGAFAGFGSRVLLTPAHTAYLKISEGCSNKCSFCSIPLMRGTQRSRSLEALVAEAEGLAARGVRELHLVAQDLTHYGFDLPGRPDLLDLVTALHGIDGIEWLRLLYAHPSHLTPRLSQGLFQLPKMTRYLDMPVQHASTRLLRAMHRPYTATSLRRQFLELRQRIPGLTLRTSVIVGFPGEGESDFLALVRFLEEIQFDRLGIFTYSREPGTPAYGLAGRPRASTVSERLQALTELQMHLAAQRARARVGTRARVLVDARLEKNAEETSPFARGAVAIGRSEGEALDIDGLVFLEGGPDLQPGRFVDVEILDADVHDLRGRVLPHSAVSV